MYGRAMHAAATHVQPPLPPSRPHAHQFAHPLTLPSSPCFCIVTAYSPDNEVAYQFYDYWGDWAYADNWSKLRVPSSLYCVRMSLGTDSPIATPYSPYCAISLVPTPTVHAATDSTGVWASTSAWDGVMGDAENARKQATKKGTGFIVNQMYAMYEYHRRAAQAYNCMMGDAVCSETDSTYSMAHGWDEGWAFFAGALESGVGDSGIDWGLTLAEKRDSSFDTHDATYNPNGGMSRVNAKMLAASQVGRDMLDPFDNATDAGQIVWDAWKCIEQQAFIPMIQGCLLYMYKSAECTADCGDEYGEMYTFCAAMVPILNDANSADAATLMTYVSPDQITATGLPQTFDTMKALIYDNLNDMGLKISEVGACTYCGDSLSDFDTSGDSAVSNKCGFAVPLEDEVTTPSPSISFAPTPTTAPTAEAHDDHGHDEDDESASCDEMNTASIIVLIVGILLAVGGVAMCAMGKNKVSP